MNRRNFIKQTGMMGSSLFLLGGVGNLLGNSVRGSSEKPNIIILLADDMGWGDVGYHGAEIDTPNIDRFVQQGVELNHFYVCPVCSPTRAGLMTGRYPIRSGLQRRTVKPWDTDRGLPPNEELIPEMLKKAGYRRRGIFGKWHLGESSRKYHPLNQGFTDFYGHYGGSINYFTHERMNALDWHRQYDLSYDKGYSTHLIGNAAVRFIEESAGQGPFFMYVAFNAIHTPNNFPQHYFDRYKNISNPKRREKAAMITAMDDNIGHILQTLDKLGIADNTFVLFCSDNGGAIKAGSINAPLRGEKHQLFEGGIRVPAAVRWPKGIKGGRMVDTPMSYIDVFPTIQHVAGYFGKSDNKLDGEDVLDIMRGNRNQRDWEFYSYFGFWLPHKQSKTDKRIFTHDLTSLNTNEWKLIRIGPKILENDPVKNSEIFLFNIKEDPYEKNNLANENPAIVKEMLDKIIQFCKLQPKGLAPVALDPPKGWKPPKTWKIPEK